MSELKLNSFSSTSPLFQSLVTFELSTYIRSSKTYYQFEEIKKNVKHKNLIKASSRSMDPFTMTKEFYLSNIVLIINIMISLQRANKHTSNIDESQEGEMLP